ncbi:MAG: carboxymuconolactone decarboxylase family protein [Nocardioidaceae bacterium]
MRTNTFPQHTVESAPAGARPRMEAVSSRFGFLPAGVALLASSPETLEGFLGVSARFEVSTLDPISREVVVLTVATRYECHVCVAMHSAALQRLDPPSGLVAALRGRRPLGDSRLEALRTFTIAAMDGNGVVADDLFAAFLAAGYDRRNALEVVLAIGAYTLSAFANRMTGAPLDDAFAPFAWTG